MKGVCTFILCALMAPCGLAQMRVADTVHNLSVSGPGQIKSQTNSRICVFCHTPHRPGKGPGLWNRRTGDITTPYDSSTTTVVPDQPTGSSAICLSCHDGTIALGEVLNPGKSHMAPDLRNTFLKGRANFGTNLSNHHPIGFKYQAALDLSGAELAPSQGINVPLDDGLVQCTTCHDPHSSRYPPFLVKSGLNGELCTSCHVQSGPNWDWATSAHAVSKAIPRAGDPWKERKAEWKGRTVADNACENCHTPHNAATPQRLIRDVEENTCFRCHNGTVSKFNLQLETQKFYRHPVERFGRGDHDTARHETALSMPFHVECEDCHNPHADRNDVPMISFNPGNPSSPEHTDAPFANGRIIGSTGIDINGQPKSSIDYEYEVCFKCHGAPGKSACDNQRCSTAIKYQMLRQDNVYNIRDKVNPGNPALVSYHPIVANNAANDTEVPSLRLDTALNRDSSLIYCGDCHNSDVSPAAGVDGPAGPHGSRYEAILTLGYELNPARRFDPASSNLCFKCHDAGNLFSDESFKHREHVVDEGGSCVNCHDPHGSATYPHLIDFLTSSSASGKTLEITGTATHREPTWEDNGRYSGTCYLTCHGVVHEGWEY